MRPMTTAGLVMCGVAIAAGSLSAQKPPSRAGVLAGVNFASLTGADVEDLESRTGFFAGAFFELPFSRNVAIEPELLYTMKGAKDTEAGAVIQAKLGYIEVPVLLKVMFPGGSESKWALRPHLYAGPAISFKMSCKFSGEDGGVSVDVDCDAAEEVGEIKGTDFSAVMGAGLDIGNLMVGARYDLGFTKISQAADGTDEDVKNGVLSIYAGFAFRLSK